jgi:signal transduction histidine kinase
MIYRDITQVLISHTEIQKKISCIFPDYVVLDNQFCFLSISQNLLETTGYSLEELSGESVSKLSKSGDLQKQLQEKLIAGYFEEAQFEITTRESNTVMFAVSGFYLGLIADVNGVIVLKLKNLDEINLTYEKIELRNNELDRFVYLSAHALRGPLATIKGLVNLANKCHDPEEMSFLLHQINSFADKLDDKLHRLIYFAESDKEEESTGELDLQFIAFTLQTALRESTVDYPVNFECHAQDKKMVLEQGGAILSLLRNVLIFLSRQSRSDSSYIGLDVHQGPGAVEMMISARGFFVGDSLKEKLRHINFGYSEILNFPELINCYAAKKIMFKLKGNIQFVMTSPSEVVVLITIPRAQPVK